MIKEVAGVEREAAEMLLQGFLTVVRSAPTFIQVYTDQVAALDTAKAEKEAALAVVDAAYTKKTDALEPIYRQRESELQAVVAKAEANWKERHASLQAIIEKLRQQIVSEEAQQRERVKTMDDEMRNLTTAMNDRRALFKITEANMQSEIDSLTMRRDALKIEIKQLVAKYQ